MLKDLKSQIKGLPRAPGIYQFYDEKGALLYVGKSKDLKKRASSYFRSKNLGPKTEQLVKKIKYIKYIKVFSEFEALMLESDLIRKNQPFYNIISRDDKSPVYIKISGEPIDLITLARKPQIEEGDFVKGPLPSAKMAKLILKRVRRIFPYCQHANPKKPCLYVHLGLCPYPYRDKTAQREYLKSINHIKKLLNGKSKTLFKELTTEMKISSEEQNYEEAAVVKRQIQNLEYLTTRFHDPRDFLEAPNLVDDKITERLTSLQNLLGLPDIPNRIECYDISNIQGKMATGSMVVFTNGQPDKREYRRFKIKFLETPNDFLMMRQVLSRRFKNYWPHPSLIVVDGGKGQLRVAFDVLRSLKLKIPVISLSKRREEIFMPNLKNPIRLQADSPARQLVQATRDEAHRFAITYHRQLRSLRFLAKVSA